jgi:transposase
VAECRWYPAAELHRLWNHVKKADPALAWWAENSKCAYQEAFRDLDRALRDFIKSRNGQRRGKRLGYPRFKKRGRCKDSFRFSTGAMRYLGVKTLLTGVDNSGKIITVEGPRALRSSLRKLRRASRGCSRKAAGSASRRQAAASLSDRIFACEACGLILDRDVNAARNLLKLAPDLLRLLRYVMRRELDDAYDRPYVPAAGRSENLKQNPARTPFGYERMA